MARKSYKLVTVDQSFWTDMDEKDIEKKYSNYNYGIGGKVTKFDEMSEYFYEVGYCDEDFINKYKDGYSASLEEAKKKVEHLRNISVSKTIEKTNCLIDEIERLKKILPPETERSPGAVGEGSWAVFAEKMMAERDEAREELKRIQKERASDKLVWFEKIKKTIECIKTLNVQQESISTFLISDEEAREIFSNSQHLENFAVAAISLAHNQVLILIKANQLAYILQEDARLPAASRRSGQMTHWSITDYGQTLACGDYEIDVGSIAPH
jgi:predicted nuclease with TOPRIM domain